MKKPLQVSCYLQGLFGLRRALNGESAGPFGDREVTGRHLLRPVVLSHAPRSLLVHAMKLARLFGREN
jgi:hypothetical protein